MSKMFTVISFCFLLLGLFDLSNAACDKSSPTTVSGTYAPRGQICSGDLIFEDNFDELDLQKWNHEVTLGGGGNWEFQWYTNDRHNSYVKDGSLFIKPTLVSDEYGEDFLWTGHIDLKNECTNSQWYGCSRVGTNEDYLNPVKSARIRTLNSFNFKYGKVEVRAKLPSGDWLWPAIWMLPKSDYYSYWPTSGEIDIMESRGNPDYVSASGVNIGTHMVGSTLHWGPSPDWNKFMLTHAEKISSVGYDADWHKYQLLWDETSITFSIDGTKLARFEPPAGGFWEWGNLAASGLPNPWRGSNSKLAPFDQEFHILLNLAIGGMNFFPDDAKNPGGKPWSNSSPHAPKDFWLGKDQWLPTWHLETDSAAFKIDYVRVWAL